MKNGTFHTDLRSRQELHKSGYRLIIVPCFVVNTAGGGSSGSKGGGQGIAREVKTKKVKKSRGRDNDDHYDEDITGEKTSL